MQHSTLKRAYFLISMYNRIVHDHLCDTRLPTLETLSFFAYGSGCAAHGANQGCSCEPKLAIHTSVLWRAEAALFDTRLASTQVYSQLYSLEIGIRINTKCFCMCHHRGESRKVHHMWLSMCSTQMNQVGKKGLNSLVWASEERGYSLRLEDAEWVHKLGQKNYKSARYIASYIHSIEINSIQLMNLHIAHISHI